METVTLLKIVPIVAAIAAVGSNMAYALWLQQAGLDGDRPRFVETGNALPAYPGGMFWFRQKRFVGS
jgi:hypothetical protein